MWLAGDNDLYLSASRETQLQLRERLFKNYMQEQINAGFPDFFHGVETGLLLLTLRSPKVDPGKVFGLKLDLQLFAKADIKMIEQTASKWKMSKAERREFGDLIEHLKKEVGKRGDDNFTWKELQEIAKDFLGK